MLEELNRPDAAQPFLASDPMTTGRIVEKKNNRAAAGPFVEDEAAILR